MIRYVEAPDEHVPLGPSVFLAGGITGCPDWQSVMRMALTSELEEEPLLGNRDLTIFNPRRADFPINNPDAAREQITWEFRYLRRATVISFWFPKESVCPIALYELGAWSMLDHPIVIGVAPGYPREVDVRMQTALVRPALRIVDNVPDLARIALAKIP